MRARVAALAALTSLCGCLETTGRAPPVIESIVAEANPRLALAARVTLEVRGADSVAVHYRPAGRGGTSYVATPAVPVTGGSATISVLGLRPETRYELEGVAFGTGGRVIAPSIQLTTGALPPDVPEFTAVGASPSPGYVLFAAGGYLVVVDNDGRVVWYRRSPGGTILNAMAQPPGRYVVRPSTPTPDDIEPWFEIDPSGEETRTFGCTGGLQPRLHDLIGEPDGGYWILCDETRSMDLSALGGSSAARVVGTVVQHVGADGALLFQWSAFDHFELADLPPSDLAGPTVNWTHGNAIDLDVDGNLLVSFRSLNEIAKIDARTGAVLWRMGGRANEFTFVGATAPPFARQHGVRASAPGEILLLDNRGDPSQSSAERWTVDAPTRTARLVQSYASTPGVTTDIGGSVQPLPGGRLLVSFGTAGRVEEYDASGAVVWRMTGNPGYVFRAQRITSLYAPGVGSAR